MKIVCAWCGASMGERHLETPGISHGICQSCLDAVMLEEAIGGTPRDSRGRRMKRYDPYETPMERRHGPHYADDGLD